MSREEQDKRIAAAVSVGIHILVFGILAAGGVFTFLQNHSQAPPIDVTVYNEDSPNTHDSVDAGKAASPSGNGETYHMPQENMPVISEAYTQEVQEQRAIKQVMQARGLSEEKARAVVDAGKTDEKTVDSSASGSETGSAAGSSDKAGTDTAASSGSNAFANSNSSDDSQQESKRPATKARLISQPDVNSYYPPDLRQKNITGTVTVHVVISADGTVTSAFVSSSSGYAAMDAAAVQIASQCQYEPARNEQGEAVTDRKSVV